MQQQMRKSADTGLFTKITHTYTCQASNIENQHDDMKCQTSDTVCFKNITVEFIS